MANFIINIHPHLDYAQESGEQGESLAPQKRPLSDEPSESLSQPLKVMVKEQRLSVPCPMPKFTSVTLAALQKMLCEGHTKIRVNTLPQ